MGVDGVVLQPFLMSVLHYVVMNAPDAESGRPTFETWFRQSGKKTEWKYCGSIGERIHPMKVVMSDYETDSPDVDFPEEDDDEAAEIMKRVPFVVQQIAPDLSTILDSKIYMIDEDLLEDDEEEPAAGQILPFSKYLKGASDFYSDKKTLLNPEEPRPFYDLYVCNDLKYHRQRYVGVRDTKPEITISDGTVQKLEAESKYIIIEGTGGIGKSMYLTHLFLTCVAEYQETGILPILVTLKDYKETTLNVLDFLLAEVSSYDNAVTQKDIIGALEPESVKLSKQQSGAPAPKRYSPRHCFC